MYTIRTRGSKRIYLTNCLTNFLFRNLPSQPFTISNRNISGHWNSLIWSNIRVLLNLPQNLLMKTCKIPFSSQTRSTFIHAFSYIILFFFFWYSLIFENIWHFDHSVELILLRLLGVVFFLIQGMALNLFLRRLFMHS